MQVKPYFIKSFIAGLFASGAGVFMALPGAAQEAPTLRGLLETLPAESRIDPSAAGAVSAPVSGESAEEMPTAEEPMEDGSVEAVEPMEDGAVEATEPMEGGSVEAVEPMEDGAVEATEPMEDEAVEAAEPTEVDTADFTIAELTSNSDAFNTLAAALDAADLTEILGDEGPYTVFAPTDEAFAALPPGSVEQLLLPENKDRLVQILSYHVVPGAVLSSDLETGSVTTVEGSDLAIAVDETDENVTVNNANVLLADIEASNGIIHVIDRVILPPAPEASTGGDTAAPVQ